MSTERELIIRAVKGDIGSQETIYNKYASKMLGVCYRYVKNYDEAMDLMHDGFIKVFTNIGNFRFECSLESWVTRIMINTSLTYLKRDISRQISREALESDKIENDITIEEFPAEIDPDTLLKLLHELPLGYRTVLNLYVFENYTHKEIAEKLSISENTSKSQLFKARKMLKELLEKYLNSQ